MATIFVVGPKASGLQHLKGDFEDYCTNNSETVTVTKIEENQGLAEINSAISNNTNDHMLFWGPGLNANVTDVYAEHSSHSWIMLKASDAPSESMTSILNNFYETLSDVQWNAWRSNPFTSNNTMTVGLKPPGTEQSRMCATFNL